MKEVFNKIYRDTVEVGIDFIEILKEQWREYTLLGKLIILPTQTIFFIAFMSIIWVIGTILVIVSAMIKKHKE